MAQETEDKRPSGSKLGRPEEGSARMSTGAPLEEGNKRFIAYVNKIKTPPLGQDHYWKNQMRRAVLKAVLKENPGSKIVVHGIRWHKSHPLQRGIDIEVGKDVDEGEITTWIVKDLRITY